jgi:tetratricopeptide (TPR) repeat protein
MSLGLAQITNDVEATTTFITKYGQYFDKLFITVADRDKTVYNQLKAVDNPKLVLSYFKWCDDFAAARNHNLTTIDTDYWLWADSDDDIINADRLPELVRYMQQNDLDVVQLKYDYAQNAQGDAISDHWRERVLKTTYDGKWSTPVHEIIQGAPAHLEKLDWVVIKHTKAPEDVVKSMGRNKKILQKHFAKTKDPRDAYYLGMTALGQKDPETAIQWFLQHIKTSGWDEDQYRSWCRIADSEVLRHQYDQALYATDEATKLKPEFPDAYYLKVLVLGSMESFDKAVEWLKVAMAKPEPTTLSIVDPTLYKYRGMAMGAQCQLFNGRVKEAFTLYQAVLKENENFFKDVEKVDGIPWDKMFEDAYFDAKAIDFTKWLLHYTKGNGGKPTKIFDALPERVFADPRLNAERVKFYPKVTWPKKSLVIYCGVSTEYWGADTIHKGMGGSEEAVVYLSRELAKLGWQVTVYNDREEEYVDMFAWKDPSTDMSPERDAYVTYKPWTLLNPYDQFDVFCAWRAPSFTRGIKARKKIIDLHDTPIGHQQIGSADIAATDLFMFKSKYQTQFAPTIPQEKISIIPNGLSKEHFNV